MLSIAGLLGGDIESLEFFSLTKIRIRIPIDKGWNQNHTDKELLMDFLFWMLMLASVLLILVGILCTFASSRRSAGRSATLKRKVDEKSSLMIKKGWTETNRGRRKDTDR